MVFFYLKNIYNNNKIKLKKKINILQTLFKKMFVFLPHTSINFTGGVKI